MPLKLDAVADVFGATEPEPFVNKILFDAGPYYDAAIPGIGIHDIRRDFAGQWTCRLTLNQESFECIRHGGWTIVDQTRRCHVLPGVAAAIQDRVRRLESREASEKAAAEPAKPKKRGI